MSVLSFISIVWKGLSSSLLQDTKDKVASIAIAMQNDYKCFILNCFKG